jgi:hypothetical protein
MTDRRLRIVVGGFLGLLPAGGIAWDYLQYPLGFAMLGHDVYYVEDTLQWPVYQKAGSKWDDSSANVAYLNNVMDAFGFAGRWAYRDEASGKCFGLDLDTLQEVCRTADIFVNVSCSTFLRDEYRRIPIRILVDSDPMFTQVQYENQATMSSGNTGMRELLTGHTHLFTFGENIGAIDSRVPTCGLTWQSTRQPICLTHWPVTPLPSKSTAAYTTLMNWVAAAPMQYANESWGQKNVEFPHYFTVPRRLPQVPFAIVVNQTTGAPFPAEEARRNCWQVLDPDEHAPDWHSYRDFIQRSRGEFSVAKETYVKARTGWFSCRSACYLASGRPVVAQETGWSRYIPGGLGLLPFHDLETAIDAVKRIESDPNTHAKKARETAEEYFDSNRVLQNMLACVGD